MSQGCPVDRALFVPLLESLIVSASIATVEEAIAYLSRNKALKVYDHTEDKPVAKTWRQHHNAANSLAKTLSPSALFAVIQRRDNHGGVWVTEWTVGGTGAGKHATRRRAAVGRSVESAMGDFQQRVSYHNSHFFFPEEGIRGFLRRVNKS